MSYEYTTFAAMSGLGAALASNGDEGAEPIAPSTNGGNTATSRWGDTDQPEAEGARVAVDLPGWVAPVVIVAVIGVVVVVKAWPFIKGGLTAYAVAPEGGRWEAAKRGALAGGVASWAANSSPGSSSGLDTGHGRRESAGHVAELKHDHQPPALAGRLSPRGQDHVRRSEAHSF